MASANEYNKELGDLHAEIDTLINDFQTHQSDPRFIMRKGKLANAFFKKFGAVHGRGPSIEFDRIRNIKTRIGSERWRGTDKVELLREAKLLTDKCRKFKNMLEGRTY